MKNKKHVATKWSKIDTNTFIHRKIKNYSILQEITQNPQNTLKTAQKWSKTEENSQNTQKSHRIHTNTHTFTQNHQNDTEYTEIHKKSHRITQNTQRIHIEWHRTTNKIHNDL